MPADAAQQDPFDLRRFVRAQDAVYAAVRAELEAGRKRTHWMWFIFPQIQGLGSSATAQAYAIRSLAEARAYLDHPTLGPRLRECTSLVNRVERAALAQIFGSPDDLKFRSSMTLFARAGPEETLFPEALNKYCGGAMDSGTLARL